MIDFEMETGLCGIPLWVSSSSQHLDQYRKFPIGLRQDARVRYGEVDNIPKAFHDFPSSFPDFPRNVVSLIDFQSYAVDLAVSFGARRRCDPSRQVIMVCHGHQTHQIWIRCE